MDSRCQCTVGTAIHTDPHKSAYGNMQSIWKVVGTEPASSALPKRRRHSGSLRGIRRRRRRSLRSGERSEQELNIKRSPAFFHFHPLFFSALFTIHSYSFKEMCFNFQGVSYRRRTSPHRRKASASDSDSRAQGKPPSAACPNLLNGHLFPRQGPTEIASLHRPIHCHRSPMSGSGVPTQFLLTLLSSMPTNVTQIGFRS